MTGHSPSPRKTRTGPLAPQGVVDLRWRVLRVGRPRESAIFEGDTLALHHGLWLDDALVAVVSLFPTPLEHAGETYPWQLRGMAADPAHQGQGLGTILLAAVEERGGAPLWCNARIRARSFYQRAGWRPIGETFEIPKVGPHQRMVRTVPSAS